MKISSTLTLPGDAVTQTFAILAKRGSGKTYAASVMAEEFLLDHQQIIIIDPTGVWWGLRSKFEILALGGERGDLPLLAESGKFVAELAVKESMSMILDVSLFGENEMVRFVGDFAQRLYTLNREAIHLFVDEADEFAPQTSINGVAAKTLGAMQRVVRRGRARGIGSTLITQRSAVLNKSVLTQTECLIALRTTGPHDLKAIDDWIKYQGTDERRKQIMSELPRLKMGEAFVYSPSWLDLLEKVQIRKRLSHDSSATPKPGEKRREPRSLKSIDLGKLRDQMAETIEKAKQNDPAALRAENKKLKSQLARLSNTNAATSNGSHKHSDKTIVNQAAIDRTVKQVVARLDRSWQQTFKQLQRQNDDLRRRMLKVAEIVSVPAETVDVPATDDLLQGLVKQQAPASSNKKSTPSLPVTDRATGQITPGRRNSLRHRMLSYLAIAARPVSRKQLAALCGVTSSNGSYGNRLTELAAEGLISRSNDGIAIATSDVSGLEMDLPVGDEIVLQALNRFGGLKGNVLRYVFENGESARKDIADACQVASSNGSFGNRLSELTKYLMVRSSGGYMINPDLYLE